MLFFLYMTHNGFYFTWLCDLAASYIISIFISSAVPLDNSYLVFCDILNSSGQDHICSDWDNFKVAVITSPRPLFSDFSVLIFSVADSSLLVAKITFVVD